MLFAGPKTKRGWTVVCRCDCGTKKNVAFADLRANGTAGCKSCGVKLRMKKEMQNKPEKIKAHLTRAAAIRALSNTSKYTAEEKRIAFLMTGAKSRCTNERDVAYTNYGGRGIAFLFSSVEDGVRWIIENLGPRPSDTHSLDRIDNNRHYEPGNLRWATKEEQSRNRRSGIYAHNGYRILWLQSQRSDCSIASIRRYAKMGWSDTQILNVIKGKQGRPRKC